MNLQSTVNYLISHLHLIPTEHHEFWNANSYVLSPPGKAAETPKAHQTCGAANRIAHTQAAYPVHTFIDYRRIVLFQD